MIIRDNFSYFSFKPYVATPHLNRLDETVQMRGHNICFYLELTKIIPQNLSSNTPSYPRLMLSLKKKITKLLGAANPQFPFVHILTSKSVNLDEY